MTEAKTQNNCCVYAQALRWSCRTKTNKALPRSCCSYDCSYASDVFSNSFSLCFNNMLFLDRKAFKCIISKHNHHAHGWRKLCLVFWMCYCNCRSSHQQHYRSAWAVNECLNHNSLSLFLTSHLFSLFSFFGKGICFPSVSRLSKLVAVVHVL